MTVSAPSSPSGLPRSRSVGDVAAEQAQAYRPNSIELVDLEREPLIWDGTDWCALHPGQRAAWQSERRYVAVFAGWRSGKTELGPWWLLREIQRVGAGDYAVLAPTFPVLDNKARPALRRAMLKALGADCYHSSGDVWILSRAAELKIWGKAQDIETRILFRHGTNADAIEGFDAKGIWFDEPGATADSIWVGVQARVSIGLRRVFFTSRPFTWNWYVTQIWQRVMDSVHRRRIDADPMVDCINFSSLDNPSFPKEEYYRQKELLADWDFALRYDGIPTKPAGLIYDCFDSRVANGTTITGTNVWPQMVLPGAWPTAIGLDFGPDNTAAVIVRQQLERTGSTFSGMPVWGEPTGLYIVEREYGPCGHDDVKDHIQGILGADYIPVMRGFIPMPRCAGGNITGEQGWRGWFSSEGLAVSPPLVTGVEAGIGIVYSFLKTRRLVVMAGCTNLTKDLETYSRELDDMGERTDKIADKSKFHMADALRSICTHFPVMGEDILLPDELPNPRYGPVETQQAWA